MWTTTLINVGNPETAIPFNFKCLKKLLCYNTCICSITSY
ncbi:hypothetical protein CXB51_007934 [Gossypium anomalum]|uniref:Uncharacterized protein n=1 Tax=Gossypium anomalum TaxID=47600 RepID=A0A8J5YZA3_9ROSI|nr:hypothetical protein CXB51_007934 [Gossypium anomalum]